MANEPSRITDNLLNVFNYSFVETVPYAFFKPNPERDIAVNLINKEYHCQDCSKVTEVKYQPRPITYYSKGKLAEERRIYDKLGKKFPFMGEIEAGVEFTNEAIGLCSDCAKKEILSASNAEQKVVNLAYELHKQDELVVAKAQAAMEQSLRDWLQGGIDEPEKFLAYNWGDFNAVRDLICAVMIEDTSSLKAVLGDYLAAYTRLSMQIRDLLAKLPDKWQAYAARSTAVFESMHDKMYHEYSVAFPAEGQIPTDYYIFRTIENKRALMFLEQPRIETVDELMMEVGFHGEWIDIVTQRVAELQKEAK